MRLGVRLGLLAQRLCLSDRAVVIAWMVGRALEGRWVRWRGRHAVILAARDADRVLWTVAPPEKLFP